ncbi:MAG: hypothetical protein GY796_09955 [Chloroflexi bacterium]|nr:hypothetical protein [Chloroflexota bacterium]
MARYQKPPDPRDPNEKRPRRLRADSQNPTPWRYLLLGIVVTIVSIVIALAIANVLLSRSPLTVVPSEPTLIVLTAPPSPVPSATAVLPTPSPIPTFTPIPTPDTAVAPPEVTVGFYAQVVNTEGAGVTVRGGPSTSNASITIANEGDILLIIGGPEADEPNNRVWWQVELADSTQGWAVGDFLQPAAAP